MNYVILTVNFCKSFEKGIKRMHKFRNSIETFMFSIFSFHKRFSASFRFLVDYISYTVFMLQ